RLGTDAGDGQVALVAAALIEQRRVHRASDRDVDVAGGQAIEQRAGVGPGELELAERGLVEERDTLAGGPLLASDRPEPGRTPEGVPGARLRRGRREPVHALPAHPRAEDRAA